MFKCSFNCFIHFRSVTKIFTQQFRKDWEEDLKSHGKEQIYTKITKNVNFEILATVPPILRNKNILGLGNPVRKSGTPDYLRSLKMLPIDFSFQKKHVQPNF